VIDVPDGASLERRPVVRIPRLTTARLTLRGFEARDADAYAAMMADPDVTRYLGDGRPLARADAWRQLAMFAGHWMLRGFGVWAVEERATGAFIGRIGCFEPEGWPGFEVAYTLARPFWGKGYAREGAGAALAHARETLGRDRIISIIRPANAGSIRVAEALGAARDGEVEFFGAPALIYRYPPARGPRSA
jgi:RimJ/RimL family protein N-acetyltransferase